jgi:hypothetical protein
MPTYFIQQLADDAGAESVDSLHVALPLQTERDLIGIRRCAIEALFDYSISRLPPSRGAGFRLSAISCRRFELPADVVVDRSHYDLS